MSNSIGRLAGWLVKHLRDANATRRSVGARRRFFRPLLEGLESRELLAFNLTISTAANLNVLIETVNNTTTFASNGAGANVSVTALNNEFEAGRNVLLTTGGVSL